MGLRWTPLLLVLGRVGITASFTSLVRPGSVRAAPRVPLRVTRAGPAVSTVWPGQGLQSQAPSSTTPVRSSTLPTLPNQPLPMVEITASGKVIRYSSTLTSIRSMFGANKLAARDVRLLRSSTPVLAPRDGYILFDFGDLRGVLQDDRLTLIGADRPAVTALGAEIQRRLEHDRLEGSAADEAPFEVRALECMLEQVYSVIEETLQRLSVLVSNTLRELTNPSSFDSEGRREAALGRLLPLRISLSSVQARNRRISEILDEILDSEDDVSDMCLTLRRRLDSGPPSFNSLSIDTIGAGKGGGAAREGEDEAEAQAMAAAEAEAAEAEAAQELMETLLDVYDARFNSLCDQIEQLASTIENTQDVLELTLDNERNRIARLELLLSMAGLSIGTCSAVSGFFGMNLLSGVENVAGLFAIVTGTSILLTGGLFATCWRQFRSISRRQRDRLMDVDALKNVLANLDLVALVLRNRPPLPRARKAMQEELRRLLTTSGMLRMSNRELAVLCSLLMQQQVAQDSGGQEGLAILRGI